MKTTKIGCGGWLMLFLAVLFAVLKLTGAIAWAWVWVMSPAWIIFLLVAFCKGIIECANGLEKWGKKNADK